MSETKLPYPRYTPYKIEIGQTKLSGTIERGDSQEFVDALADYFKNKLREAIKIREVVEEVDQS